MNILRTLSVALILYSVPAEACPRIGRFVDYNCDGVHKIAITGDSLVKGVGDKDVDYGGGYVSRIQEKFPKSVVENLGVAGITTGLLLKAFKSRLSAEGDNITKQKTFGADMFIIDVGRNDYWAKGKANLAARNIYRIARYIKAASIKATGVSPIFAIAELAPSRRAFQQPFIDAVNRSLLQLKYRDYPVDINFTVIPAKAISDDGIHPSAAGYDKVAMIAERYIAGKGQERSRAARPDTDRDGIYDLFETTLFHTDPTLADTDGDGYSDGAETFTFRTDPNDPASFPVISQ